MEINSCEELNGMQPIQRAVTVCQELSRKFKIRQCMSRVVTNSGRQRFRVAVNGASLSDDPKKNGQGRNPRIREEKHSHGRNPKNREERAVPTAGKRAVPTAGNDVNL